MKNNNTYIITRRNELGETDRECLPMPESHKVELGKRLAKYKNSGGRLLSLKELQTRMEKRK